MHYFTITLLVFFRYLTERRSTFISYTQIFHRHAIIHQKIGWWVVPNNLTFGWVLLTGEIIQFSGIRHLCRIRRSWCWRWVLLTIRISIQLSSRLWYFWWCRNMWLTRHPWIVWMFIGMCYFRSVQQVMTGAIFLDGIEQKFIWLWFTMFNGAIANVFLFFRKFLK